MEAVERGSVDASGRAGAEWASAAIVGLAALVALGALARHGTGYFTVTRWAVSVGLGVAGARMIKSGKAVLAIGFAVGALLFNPIAPFFFARGTWRVLDVSAAVALLAAAGAIMRKGPE